MTQSASHSETNTNLSNHQLFSRAILPPFSLELFACIALIAYVLPAITNPGAALTLNSFDLAEWASLHPAAAANNLQGSLFLRIQPVLIGVILAINLPVNRRSALFWSGLLLLGLIALALFPPLEFLTEPENNNYRQQFFLSVLTLATGIIIFTGLLYRFRTLLTIILLIFALLSYGWALSESMTYMQPYGLAPGIGTGAILLLVSYAVLLIYILLNQIKTNRAAV
ncbi:MAG: hypothetical protein ACPG7F_10510 [Aggregatilineales bacterium]